MMKDIIIGMLEGPLKTVGLLPLTGPRAPIDLDPAPQLPTGQR